MGGSSAEGRLGERERKGDVDRILRVHPKMVFWVKDRDREIKGRAVGGVFNVAS